MKVYVVSLEWNQPSSEVTGDPGLVGVYATREAADRAAAGERKEHDENGEQVYGYTMGEGVYCPVCGEREPCYDAACVASNEDGAFCDQCGAEAKDTGSCDNDHDEWTIDVHVTEMEVL